VTELVVESIRLRDILAFAESTALSRRRDDMVAVSRSRARAWQHNPHASPDDTVLLVARVGKSCAGYLGLLPSRLRIAGHDERVDWITSCYVPREWRDAGVGALLLMRACGTGHSLAVSGASTAVARIYSKLGFVSLGSVHYFELDLVKANVLGAPFRGPRRLAAEAGLRTRVFDLGVETAARITKGCVIPLLRAALAPPARVHTKSLEGPLDRDFERVADQRHPARFLRDASVIDWMLRHPWVTTNGLEEQPGYRFDDFRDDAGYRLLEIHDDRSRRGFAVLLLSTHRGVRQVRLLDHHLDDPADALLLPSIVAAAARHLFASRERHTYLRPGRASAELDSVLPNLHLDYCDGDASFA
jgi:GNAT superfamily N-acetyltransferase